ncbi:MAG TPA: aminotransferase class V-fold PLP-dependent enzyme [Candidatus Dormibacteraeota bacterium]|nr:aminotransferase class V-fold PLP-dependent enzyme [Candidatus Dormibacteraeota bacterium]
MSRIYLDDAGSAPVLTEVRDALRDLPNGNPSSPHAEGRAARAALDRARDMAAEALDADRTEISFTSSGTEAVNLALFGAARRLSKRGVVVTWAAEHQSVLGAVRRLQSEGHSVEVAAVDKQGRADAGDIPASAALVSIGLANNEIGTIQPVAAIIARAHEIGAVVHVDASAGPRWIPIPEGADLLSLSGHKLGAGRGGILYVRDGVRIDPLLYGGPQEWGRRGGREDVGAATAVARALATCVRDRASKAGSAARQAASLRTLLVEMGGELTGADARLPNFATCAFADRRGEDLLLALDLAGVAASSGSACASGSLDPSHVLLAMGLSLEQALGSLRLTTAYATTDEEVSRGGAIIRAALARTKAHA